MDNLNSDNSFSSADEIDSAGELKHPPKPPKRGRLKYLFIALLGLLVLFSIAVGSGIAGYQSGISIRKDVQATQVVSLVQEQFELSIQDIEQNAFDRARQRLEYVILLDPDYPGATEKLADVLLNLSTTATPTQVPTPTVSPTPDMRGNEELFNQATQYSANNEWTNSIDTLLKLRKVDPNYRTVEVDGLLFLALRNRGMDKIMKEADLEGGIYDLTLAERFGYLDTEAQSLKNFSSLYITGASFWGLDWVQAVDYFSQVAPHAPGLTDGSGWTAADRYRLALSAIAYQLADEGRFCKAVDQFQLALSYGYDAQVEQDMAAARANCEKGKPQEEATPTP